MTAVPDIEHFRVTEAQSGWMHGRAVARVTEAFWGYRIAGRRAPIWLVGMQGLCWLTGIVLGVAAIGIWAVPGAGTGAGFLGFKLGASVPLGALAVLLLWHASRGTALGVEVDLRMGEVREVLSNRAGRSAVLSRHGFDAVSGVTLERRAGRGDVAVLVLRLREGAEALVVARGSEVMLAGLLERLGRDLMVGRRKRVADVIESAGGGAAPSAVSQSEPGLDRAEAA
jgi:hypothetical protein